MTDQAEFENFYNETRNPLFSYVCRVSGSRELADDIVQESFLRFLSASERKNENQKAFLYRIATNLIYDYFRRNSVAQRHQTATADGGEPSEESSGLSEEMSNIFERLKIQERALLWMAYVEGYDHGEIAAALGLQRLSVRVLLFRARRRLAALLGEK